ncbi:fumarylacetoacetate hydrolase domain-containing protein 2A [Zalerion maritima]|uniref:Fumarylacetoacetate hydrolase domain-containing protein 2A n=1 Tax=Zalerion maritima TaxID=339359 RepID=A0AAD5WQ41_9PEZI|nr:fumarylacetoacetate hydrolase domain-containing protein 2A [Zalerion maritima]
MSGTSWTHLIRFVAVEDGLEHLGQICNPPEVGDVGLASLRGEEIKAYLVTGSVFDGRVTDKVMTVSRRSLPPQSTRWNVSKNKPAAPGQQLLSPLRSSQVPVIRCLGLNYRDHAREANMEVPAQPVLFLKPRTALSGPRPEKTPVPRAAQDGSSDYEAELVVVVGRDVRDAGEGDAMDCVLGYTAGNDVSARTHQWRSSQWCFSKVAGFDGSCPIGPALVSRSAITDPQSLGIKATLSGATVQDSSTSQMIFSVAKTIAFLSQGITIERGTLIMMGTPPGIGAMRDPKVWLKDGDDMRVWIEGIGTLVNEIYYE